MSMNPNSLNIRRREFLATSATASATLCLTGTLLAAPVGKRTFTILHTNDLHSNLIGPSPASDYSPFSLNDDKTRGGFARLATLIAQRKIVGPHIFRDCFISFAPPLRFRHHVFSKFRHVVHR